MRSLLFIMLSLFAVFYIFIWIKYARSDASAGQVDLTGKPKRPSWLQTLIGFVTNFFDTLGIGSFAPTTAVYKLTRLVPDDLIPGTMNVGHTLPVVVMAFIFISIIEVDTLTLYLMISISVVGAWLGAGIVAALPRRTIRLGMGAALLTAALLMVMTQLDLFPVGSDLLGLRGLPLLIAAGGSFIFGALSTIGIGFYAPCMILVSLLGMNPKAAFPIMMGSCAFLMPVASFRFIQKGKYKLSPAVGLTVGGIPAVLIAAFIVKSLNVNSVRWLVVVVVFYTAFVMLYSAGKKDLPARP